MNDDGDTKDDVRVPEGEVGEKINRLFKIEEKDTSKLPCSFRFTPSVTMEFSHVKNHRRRHPLCHG